MAKCQFRILIKSIGTAQPKASIAVAAGLGLPAPTVIAQLYSAPSILVDNIDESIAIEMVKLLNSIGYEAEAQHSVLPPPATSPLYDVAIYLKDTRKFQHAIEVVTDFTGINEDDASRMILSPPGVILGSVSKATINILANQLGSGISLLSSLADTAHYHLFLNEDNGTTVHKRILQDLNDTGLELCGYSGLVATHVDHPTAQQLWQRYQASGLIRIVNQDFLRFDLILEKSLANNQIKAKQVDILEQTAKVPSEMVAEVLQSAPITLLESIPSAEIEYHMTEFTNAGLKVKAEMITFQMLRLEVLSLSSQDLTKQALEGFDLHDPRETLPAPPFTLFGVMPELRARIIRDALEDTGAEVAFVEVSA